MGEAGRTFAFEFHRVCLGSTQNQGLTKKAPGESGLAGL